MRKTHNVMFQSAAGTLEVSHQCTESEVKFWMNEGYFVRRIGGIPNYNTFH